MDTSIVFAKKSTTVLTIMIQTVRESMPCCVVDLVRSCLFHQEKGHIGDINNRASAIITFITLVL